MRGKQLALAATPVLASLALATLVLSNVLWAQPGAPAGQSAGSSAMSPAANDRGEMIVHRDEIAEAAPDDDGAVTVADGEREAAAGPQPEEESPLAPMSTPVAGLELQPSVRRVGIQAGHWKSAELPDELARLRTSTGTAGGGKAEWEVNLDVAERVAALLRDEDVEVDVLPATVPPGYKADVFVALHADGDASGRLSGFKLARARWSTIPEVDDALLAAITEEYAAVTELPEDTHVSRNMTGYYAFNNRRFQHAVAPTTPAVILEMGFLTNASDRRLLLGAPATVAEGIARGIMRFLGERGA